VHWDEKDLNEQDVNKDHNNEIFAKFGQEIANLTERSITMGIEEFLLDRAEKKGIEEGMTQKELEKNLAFTHNLLSSTDLSISKIAKLVGVDESFVLKVKNELGK
jgi:predicted DNA binding CopG/RHH family protein